MLNFDYLFYNLVAISSLFIWPIWSKTDCVNSCPLVSLQVVSSSAITSVFSSLVPSLVLPCHISPSEMQRLCNTQHPKMNFDIRATQKKSNRVSCLNRCFSNPKQFSIFTLVWQCILLYFFC